MACLSTEKSKDTFVVLTEATSLFKVLQHLIQYTDGKTKNGVALATFTVSLTRIYIISGSVFAT